MLIEDISKELDECPEEIKKSEYWKQAKNMLDGLKEINVLPKMFEARFRKILKQMKKMNGTYSKKGILRDEI